MSTTTPAALRTTIAARITSLAPSIDSGAEFLEHLYDQPLAEWALANSAGCLRRFSVTEGDGIDGPDVTDGLVEAVWQDFIIEVAYPADIGSRYGGQQRVSLTGTISADRAQIAKTVGTNGTAYTDATVQTAPGGETRVDLGDVQLGIVRLRARYFRSATP